MPEERKREVKVRFEVPPGGPPPEAANFSNLAVNGADVQMLIGYVDLRHLVWPDGVDEIVVQPEVSHRFALGMRGFLHLKGQVDDIFNKLVQQGVIEDSK